MERTTSRGLIAATAVLAAGNAAALIVSTTASITRGDFVFGLGSWFMFVMCAAACGGLVLVMQRRKSTGAGIAALLVGMVVAFPVGAEWDEEGQRASGLVPAAQAAVMPVWPRSGWNSDRPRGPLVGYVSACCG